MEKKKKKEEEEQKPISKPWEAFKLICSLSLTRLCFFICVHLYVLFIFVQ